MHQLHDPGPVVHVPDRRGQPLPGLRAVDPGGGVRDRRRRSGDRPHSQPLVPQRRALGGATRHVETLLHGGETGRLLHRCARSRSDAGVHPAGLRPIRGADRGAVRPAGRWLLLGRAGDALLPLGGRQRSRPLDEEHVPAVLRPQRLRPPGPPSRPVLRRDAQRGADPARLLHIAHSVLHGRVLPAAAQLVRRPRCRVHGAPPVRGVAPPGRPGRGKPLLALPEHGRGRRRSSLPGDRDQDGTGSARRDQGGELGRAPGRVGAADLRVVRGHLHGRHDATDEVDRRLGVRPWRQRVEPARVPLHARGTAQA